LLQKTGDDLKKVNLGSADKKKSGYINVDINPEANPDIVHDLNKPLPFENNSIDEINADYLIEHISNINLLFDECSRVLKTHGTLYISTPNAFFWRNRLKFLFGTFNDCSAYHIWHCWLYKPSQLKILLQSRGFRVEIQGHGLLPYPDLFYFNFRLKAVKIP